MADRLIVRAVVLICMGMLFGCSSRRETNQFQRTPTRSAWRSPEIPSRPVYVTAIGDSFWVSGTNEMLARSDDGGQSWRIMHQKLSGEVLMEVQFIENNLGYAAGTGGLILWTRDGGETWKPRSTGSGTILDLSFADEKHGIRRTKSATEFTRDGGLTWLPIPPLTSPENRERFKIDFGVSALDSKHSAVLLKDDPQGDQIFLFTNDAGKTWNEHYFPNAGIMSLVVHDRKYWAFGGEVIEKDKPGGGYSIPLAIHSTDGTTWIHGVRSEAEYSSCNMQGCILWDGTIVDLYHDKPRYIAVPAEGVLTSMWAAAGGSVCTVSVTLKCAKARVLDAPPPRVKLRHGSVYSSADKNLPTSCLICPLDSLFLYKEALAGHTITTYSKFLDDGTPDERSAVQNPGVQSLLHVNFLVRNDGTVDEVRVRHAPTREIESAVSNYIGDWILEPPRRNGTPAEEQYTVILGISCFSSPADEEATCLLRPFESDSSLDVSEDKPRD